MDKLINIVQLLLQLVACGLFLDFSISLLAKVGIYLLVALLLWVVDFGPIVFHEKSQNDNLLRIIREVEEEEGCTLAELYGDNDEALASNPGRYLIVQGAKTSLLWLPFFLLKAYYFFFPPTEG